MRLSYVENRMVHVLNDKRIINFLCEGHSERFSCVKKHETYNMFLIMWLGVGHFSKCKHLFSSKRKQNKRCGLNNL